MLPNPTLRTVFRQLDIAAPPPGSSEAGDPHRQLRLNYFKLGPCQLHRPGRERHILAMSPGGLNNLSGGQREKVPHPEIRNRHRHVQLHRHPRKRRAQRQLPGWLILVGRRVKRRLRWVSARSCNIAFLLRRSARFTARCAREDLPSGKPWVSHWRRHCRCGGHRWGLRQRDDQNWDREIGENSLERPKSHLRTPRPSIPLTPFAAKLKCVASSALHSPFCGAAFEARSFSELRGRPKRSRL